MPTFDHALSQLGPASTATYGPFSFQQYLAETGQSDAMTAAKISVDSIRKLSPELRSQSVMVFRLGDSGQGGRTNFALARSSEDWRDFFLLDEEIFRTSTPAPFVPVTPVQDIFAFQMLPGLTESSFVNLALASGLLGRALQLDDPTKPIVPASGNCRFTFQIKARSDIPSVWSHNAGQVEVDALFFAERQGVQTLFVVEAKQSRQLESLGKHKLVYALVGLRQSIPRYIPIIPVYLRVVRLAQGTSFNVAECEFPEGDAVPCISDLKVKTTRRLILPDCIVRASET